MKNTKLKQKKNKNQLNKRVNKFIIKSNKDNNNIIYGLYLNKYKIIKTELHKEILKDLDIIFSSYKNHYKIISLFQPNKPITKKGILVRMGKGKGKIKTYSNILSPNSLYMKLKINKIINFYHLKNLLNSFFKKYYFLSLKK